MRERSQTPDEGDDDPHASATTALALGVRQRLGPPPALEEWPSISIVVLNRNGVEHLRRLLAGLIEHTEYPRLELIVVDNGSSDGSLDFLRRVEAPFPISILANPHNESFSDANNQGAALASGELLLLLNNDVEPFDREWLRELVACQLRTGAGAVASILIDPPAESDPAGGPLVQTRNARLRAESDTFAAEYTGGGELLLDEMFDKDVETAVAIGACLLVEGELFRSVGGLTHGYFYGGEDEDLCLKLRERGAKVVHCGRSILIHHRSSTSRALHGERGGPTRRGNTLNLLAHWAPRLWREMQLDLRSGSGLWAAPNPRSRASSPSIQEILALGFCLIADSTGERGDHAVAALDAELTRRGHRHTTLRDDAIDDPAQLFYDVAVYVHGPNRYVPRPGRLNVLWVVDHFDGQLGAECQRYDLAVTDDGAQAERLRVEGGGTPVTVLDRERSAAALIDSVQARAEQVRLPTRIGHATSRTP